MRQCASRGETLGVSINPGARIVAAECRVWAITQVWRPRSRRVLSIDGERRATR